MERSESSGISCKLDSSLLLLLPGRMIGGKGNAGVSESGMGKDFGEGEDEYVTEDAEENENEGEGTGDADDIDEAFEALLGCACSSRQ
ncbi:hypothetical protein BGX28_009431 [Mortierella sp. GBA30]|nr:hypothetical protein BGX28_009431 [Mortierella sp. GBA30]